MRRPTRDPLRQAIRQVQRLRNPKRRRYGVALRRKVIDHVVAERSHGVSVRATAQSLGLPYKTLCIWLQGRSLGFRAVATKTAAPAVPRTDLRLVTADGHRVEGLSPDQLVAVLRALS